MEHIHGVEQGGSLKKHTYLLTQKCSFTLSKVVYVSPIEKYLSSLGGEQPYNTSQQYGFPRAAAADDKIGLSCIERSADTMKYFLMLEIFVYVGNGNHAISRFVSNRSVNNISTLLTTTELVPALPTSMLPPRTV